MALVSKLFQLKKYLSIDDTAKLLAISLGEPITNIDVLDLILDNHIMAKVKATHSNVKVLPFSIEKPVATIGNCVKIYKPATDDGVIEDVKCGENFTNQIKLKGYKHFIVNLATNDYWSFPMIGGNRLAIENYKRKLTGQNLIDAFDGFIYLKTYNGYDKLYELKKEKEFIKVIEENGDLDIDNYKPATEINNDIELVIEMEEIRKFEQSLLEEPREIDYEKSQLLIASILKVLKDSNPKKWTQGELSDLISEQSQLKGLGKRKIDAFFSQCNKLLDNSMK
jgi:hypothetical protein